MGAETLTGASVVVFFDAECGFDVDALGLLCAMATEEASMASGKAASALIGELMRMWVAIRPRWRAPIRATQGNIHAAEKRCAVMPDITG